MAFQVSPGINVSEIDLTTSVPALATTVGGFGGVFRWGPVGKFVLVDSENTLTNRFGKPTSDNYETFYTAANFLSYGNALYVSRAATTSGFANTSTITLDADTSLAANGTALGVAVGTRVQGDGIADDTFVTAVTNSAITISKAATTSASALISFIANATTLSAYAGNTAAVVASNVVIKNSEEFENKGATNTAFTGTEFVARYPGALGNSLKVSMCDSATQYAETVTFETNTTWGSTTANAYALADLTSATMSINVGSNTANVVFVWSNDDFADRVAASANAVTLGSNNVSANFISLTAANTTFTNGDAVWYSRGTASSANSIQGLAEGTTYYVIAANTTGLSLSVASGGAAATISNGAANSVVFITKQSATDLGLTLAQARLAVTALRDKITVGDYVEVGNTTIGKQNMKVTSEGAQADDGTNIFFNIGFDSTWNKSTNFSGTSLKRQWEYFNVVESAPGVSSSMTGAGRTIVDEVSVVVVDEDGLISGTPGQVLEIYQNLSRATDAKKDDGTTNYYKTAVNDFSRWIWATNDRSGAASATLANLANSTNTTTYTKSFVRGVDGASETNVSMAALGSAYDLFADASTVDVSLILQGKATGSNDVQLANYLIDNIAEVRKDCVVFVSPAYSDVVGFDNQNVSVEGLQAQNIVDFRNALHNTSYAFMDSGYKYQYDKYADVYRYIPLNGDMAGITARSDSVRDPWFSPAGFTRGQVKNLVKLAFSPSKSERDLLYKNDVNPVVTFPGQGTVLYGDKTLLGRVSAFDRINVRRLFIVLEKAIATASNSTLFEFNDEFTRSQFRNLVEPYLRDVQGRRGIVDFRVVCDETNNTAEVIDSNRFVGDIYIKPARSINFIQLNFVAVRSGVEFNEIAGQF